MASSSDTIRFVIQPQGTNVGDCNTLLSCNDSGNQGQSGESIRLLGDLGSNSPCSIFAQGLVSPAIRQGAQEDQIYFIFGPVTDDTIFQQVVTLPAFFLEVEYNSVPHRLWS